MRDYFKIAGNMFEHVGQGLPCRVALFNLKGNAGQAGVVVNGKADFKTQTRLE